MDDEKLLKTLAEAARRRASNDNLDVSWDEHSAGQLSKDELAKLRQELYAGKDQKSVEDAFTPLDEGFRNDVVNQLKDQLSDAVPEVAESDKVTAIAAPEIAESDKVTAMHKPRFVNFPTALAATLLAALGLSLMLRTGEEVMNLPHYEYVLQGGTEFRSSEVIVENRVFKLGERLQLTLTPESRTEQNLIGKAFIVTDGQVLEIDSISIEIAESGAARLSGRMGDEIPVNYGDHEMVVVIGVPNSIPAAKQLQEHIVKSDQAAGNGWQAWRIDFSVSER